MVWGRSLYSWGARDLSLERLRQPLTFTDSAFFSSSFASSGQALSPDRDGLSDLATRHPDLHPPDLLTPHAFYTLSTASSTQALPTLLLDYPLHTLAYLALGPLTSLAHLHALSPSPAESLLHHFGPILVMGGAIDVPGNTSPVAEFNTYADPVAASTIFSLGCSSLHLFPLDITTPHTLPFDLYALLVDEHFVDTLTPSRAHMKAPLVHFTSAFLERTREVVRRFGGVEMEMHDPLVVWAAIEWSRSGGKVVKEGQFAPGWKWERKEFEVETCVFFLRSLSFRSLVAYACFWTQSWEPHARYARYGSSSQRRRPFASADAEQEPRRRDRRAARWSGGEGGRRGTRDKGGRWDSRVGCVEGVAAGADLGSARDGGVETIPCCWIRACGSPAPCSLLLLLRFPLGLSGRAGGFRRSPAGARVLDSRD